MIQAIGTPVIDEINKSCSEKLSLVWDYFYIDILGECLAWSGITADTITFYQELSLQYGLSLIIISGQL